MQGVGFGSSCLSFLHTISAVSHYSRFKTHRKALVTTVDKKIPNGFLEEQGTVVRQSVQLPALKKI